MPTAELCWTVHPARRAPARTALAIGVVAVAALFAGVVGGHAGWSGFAAGFLLIAISPFLFPTRYALSDDAIEVRRLGAKRTRPWSSLRLVRESTDGILLSPSARPGLLDPVRNVFVRFPEDAEPVRAYVHGRLGR